MPADDLLLKLDFRDPDPEIIDLSPEGGLVATLKECKVECMLPEKVSTGIALLSAISR